MALTKEAREYFVKQGRKGGKIAARKMTPEERNESARRAAQARWSRTKNLVRGTTEGTKELLEVAGKGGKTTRTTKTKQKKKEK